MPRAAGPISIGAWNPLERQDRGPTDTHQPGGLSPARTTLVLRI
jgi:hypothetical protein